MDKLNQITHFLVNTATYFFILLIVLRFLLQLVRADFYNPLSQFIAKATNPLVIPLRKVVPSVFGVDMASLVLMIALQMIAVQLLAFIQYDTTIPAANLVILSFYRLIALILDIYFFSFIILVVISWVAPRTQNPAISILYSLTEPVLQPIRRVIPAMGGLDFSIMIAMLLIIVIKILLGIS